MITWYTTLPSPVGPLLLAADDAGLRAIEFEHNRHPVRREGEWRVGTHPLIEQATKQLAEYFVGQRRVFDVPLAPRGTAFQISVWRALSEIEYGLTISYAELARRIENPAAVRAVGAANGRNPLPIIVPCHRVIGADGSLVGFGGGLPVKVTLLGLERGGGGLF